MIATLEQLKYTQQMKLRDRKDQITNEELVKVSLIFLKIVTESTTF